jgi:hypothetical protein
VGEAVTPGELKQRYDAGERDFQGVNLQGACLPGVNLSFACLQGAYLASTYLQHANLRGANLGYACLRGADLEGASLQGANLQGAELYRADLQDADLQDTDLRYADFSYANLSFVCLYGASLSRASLQGANLRYANLRGTNLLGANFEGANLRGTCLAPDAVCAAPPTDEDIKRAGLELRGGKVYGWRTKKSQHCGSTVYEVGKEYTAPWFSVDHTTECHPGRYLAGKEWLDENYKGFEVVRVYCLRSELVHAGTKPNNKWRARRLWVVEAEEGAKQ